MLTAAPSPDADRRLFTADEVLRMAQTGILAEDEHVELLDGELCTVSPQGPAHRTLAIELRDRLTEVYGRRVHVQDHSNVRLGDRSLPEPDVAVVRGTARDYMDRLPGGADLLLVVEIAVTSHARDRRKIASYARGGVAMYWMLDVPARTLTVHEDPRPDGTYAHVRTLDATGEVSPPESGVSWSVALLLP